MTSQPPRILPIPDAQAAAARLILPEATRWPGRAAWFGICEEGSATWQGVMVLRRDRRRPRAFRVGLRVLQHLRRQGLGTSLIVHARRWSQGQGGSQLLAWKPVPGDGQARFLEHCGFGRLRTDRYYEGEIEQLYPLIERLERRCLARGHVPAGARLTKLSQVPLPDVRRFHQEHLGGTTRSLASRLRGQGKDNFHPDSPILLVDDELQGMLLGEVVDDTARVDAKIVAPVLRGGWANLALMKQAMDEARTKGASRFSFKVVGQTHDTMKLAARAGAAEIKQLHQYSLRLDS